MSIYRLKAQIKHIQERILNRKDPENELTDEEVESLEEKLDSLQSALDDYEG
jgi:chromosome segregation ATPase